MYKYIVLEEKLHFNICEVLKNFKCEFFLEYYI